MRISHPEIVGVQQDGAGWGEVYFDAFIVSASNVGWALTLVADRIFVQGRVLHGVDQLLLQNGRVLVTVCYVDGNSAPFGSIDFDGVLDDLVG